MCSRAPSTAAAMNCSAFVRRLQSSSSGSNVCSNIAVRFCSGVPSKSILATAVPPCPSSGRDLMPAVSRSLACAARGFSSRAEAITTTRLTVEGGAMTVPLPLPGLAGLTDVSVSLDTTVREFVSELMARDKSLTAVDVANADGNKVAACTSMADIATRGLLVSLGGRSRIRVLSSGGGDHHATEVPEPEVYTLIQAEVVQAGRVTLTRDSLDELCAKMYRKGNPERVTTTLDPMLADGWLNALVEDGLVFTADKGRMVLLNPSGPGVSDEIARALRKDDELIDLKVSALRQQLNALYSEDARLQGIRDVLIAKAQRQVTLKKGAVLAFMTAQFGTLAYCVYEVYSWDVMEPATYFLMLSYSVGSSLYFSTKNREASFENLEGVALKRSEAKLKSAHGYSRTSHDELKGEIKRYEEAVELLSSHRDAHPPTGPAMAENPALG